MFKLMFFFFTKYSDLVPIMGSIYDNNDKNFTSLIPLDTACLRIYLTVFTPSSLFIEQANLRHIKGSMYDNNDKNLTYLIALYNVTSH